MTDEELHQKIRHIRKDIRLLSGHIRCLESELLFVRQTFDETYQELYPLEMELARREERYHIIPPHRRKPPKPLAVQIADQMREQSEEVKLHFFRSLCQAIGIDPNDVISRVPQMEEDSNV